LFESPGAANDELPGAAVQAVSWSGELNDNDIVLLHTPQHLIKKHTGWDKTLLRIFFALLYLSSYISSTPHQG
jgi:hypothetical protein